MTFLNPLFLFGLLASSLPVLIHLLTRRRPRRVEFSSVEFLREVRLAEMRRFRLREWLLLLLRALAVAALALALARPAFRGTAVGGRGSTTALVLIDRSYSMRTREGDRDLFERAKTRALEVLDALEAEDRVQVMTFDTRARALFPEPVEDHGRARSAIEGLEPGSSTTDLEAGLSAAIEALSRSPALHRELYVITDLQRAGLAREAPARTIPPGLAVTFLAVGGPSAPANRAASDARYRSGETPAVQVGVRAFGDVGSDAGTASVSGGSSRDVPVTIRAQTSPGNWREAGRGFVPLAGAEGSALVIARQPIDLAGEAVLGEDALPFDDHRVFAAGQSGATKLAYVSGEANDPLALALEGGQESGRVSVSRLAPEALTQASLTGKDAVVLDDVGDLSEGSLQAVVDFTRAGGGVLLVLGPHTDPNFVNGRLFEALGGMQIQGAAPVKAERGAWALRRSAVGHPALAGFPDAVGEAVSQAKFTSAWRVNPGSEGRVLASFAPDLPALLERERLLVFTSDAAGAWSDFPFSGSFLPFWLQSLAALAQGNSPDLIPGERLDLPAPPGGAQAVWSLRAPNGQEIPLESRLAEGSTRLLSPPLEDAGLYLVMASGRALRAVPVNPDLRESDLGRLSAAQAQARWHALAARVVPLTANATRAVREGRYGREMWREFLILALLLLAAETILGRLWGSRSAKAGEFADEPDTAPRARATGTR
ncbi:MAG TPA: BatA and WFA domain-containing protein [Candidatus Eisenbacteria bacterium]|nr:BatA and WFA domain-containing protein [Candidatus Eisenbacteria bacterium]